MPLFQLTFLARGAREKSGSTHVAKVVRIIERSGLPYQLNGMATLIEGEWDEVIETVNRARVALRRDNDRVYMVLAMDDRKGARKRMQGKVESVEKKLGRKVKRL